jgi:hypothetical protein
MNNTIKQDPKKLLIGCLGFLAFFIFFVVIILVIVPDGEYTDISNYGSVGDDVVLNYNDDIGNCDGQLLIGLTEEALDESIKAAVADDSFGQFELVASGQAFMLPNCTIAKVIDRSFGKSEVRIMEGDYLGQSGWIPYEFARLVSADDEEITTNE